MICVHGKGNKVRVLPLASETVRLLDHYLRLERPAAGGSALFVSLKGRARGTRITPAGLRSLFRYHRLVSGVAGAHPHRFRHTFASDMVRAGIISFERKKEDCRLMHDPARLQHGPVYGSFMTRGNNLMRVLFDAGQSQIRSPG